MGDRTVRPDMRGRVTEETIANWANMAVVLFGLLAAGAGVCALYFNARASTALTTEASQAIEAADARAAAAEGALREVHQRIDPRRLSAGQQQELAALLSASVDKGPVTVTSVAGDLEGKILADQIDGVLKAAEWAHQRRRGRYVCRSRSGRTGCRRTEPERAARPGRNAAQRLRAGRAPHRRGRGPRPG